MSSYVAILVVGYPQLNFRARLHHLKQALASLRRESAGTVLN
ncbi:hypothetical protein JMJ77_0011890 [Colletotrichum scovillei]|uniref:Uncharacterized protein n=1 Tax=Colletotrichum scovillei TaxID=1209932 RepID=A0A9P7QVT0_9PEZI|nr:hypothetical protein JMJ77_0011890 [Colletotrichum scovillei]KAG7046174.1 hypothetical protein JMJ78_0011241 [Colletotrichum scovillei]KAG7063521.1 hypothetical protein JMJ76_0005985 [Colletotrichum scovillei]